MLYSTLCVLMKGVSVRLKSKKVDCYQGLEPVFISRCYDTLIPLAPLPPDVLYHLSDCAVCNHLGLCCLHSLRICSSMFTDPTQFQLASFLCDRSLSNWTARRSQSLLFSIDPSEHCISMIHHLGEQGTGSSRLIVHLLRPYLTWAAIIQ